MSDASTSLPVPRAKTTVISVSLPSPVASTARRAAQEEARPLSRLVASLLEGYLRREGWDVSSGQRLTFQDDLPFSG